MAVFLFSLICIPLSPLVLVIYRLPVVYFVYDFLGVLVQNCPSRSDFLGRSFLRFWERFPIFFVLVCLGIIWFF